MKYMNWMGACAATALMTGNSFGVEMTETQTRDFMMRLGPNMVELMFEPFDTQGGTRTLLSVQLTLEGTISADVAAENDSDVPAKKFAVSLNGALTGLIFEPPDIIFLNVGAVDMADTGGVVVAASDGVPGSGPDYFVFGTLSGGSSETVKAPDPMLFIGDEMISYVVNGNAFFEVTGASDATIVINNLFAEGTATVAYTFDAPATGACCLPDETCVPDLTQAACEGAGGTYRGDAIPCTPTLCVPPGECPPRVSTTEKGSLAVFSKIELRWNGAPPYDLIQDTYISITNDSTSNVRAQLYFVNGDDPLPADPATGERAHPGWNAFDNQITLTARQPACFRVSDGTGTINVGPFPILDFGSPPGRPAMDGSGDRVLRGFLYAWAVNPNGEEIRWNHLFGSGTVVNHAGPHTWEYPSWNHAVVADVPDGQAPDAIPGQLLLDGVEYALGFDRLRFNFLSSGSDRLTGPFPVVNELDLTLHPEDVDFRQEGDGPVTTKADFLVWNENETPFSQMHRCLTCWDQQIGELYTSLPEQIGVPNNFLESTLQTDCGYARIDGRASQLCDLDFDPANNDTFPFPPGPGDPVDPRDVVSQDVALLGVAARLLRIDLADPGYNGASGYGLVGSGTQSGVVRYDPSGGSDEGVDMDLPMRPTHFEIERFLERILEEGAPTPFRR